MRLNCFIACLPALAAAMAAPAQQCPPNIDFEKGNFDGWSCYTGNVAAVGGENIITLFPSAPEVERHTMYTMANLGDVDFYGGFPVLCPNGSGYSIRLGNNFGGGQAEGVAYEFTIPATADKYNLIYNYAVVFEDPNHQRHQQPRMEIEITNVTDSKLIECSSFSFVPVGSGLPGFFQSPFSASLTPVWCKDWTAVTINLDNHAGKRIRLLFKTADCTFTRHFGYAYIDVNSECSGTFLGAAFCPDDTALHVTAPFGYAQYTWYDSTLTQVLGNNQVLQLMPPPSRGTTVAVKVEPYAGYGCEQILYARLYDTLTVTAVAGPDVLSCNKSPVLIGSPPKPGIVYQWSPATDLSRSDVANPFARPSVTRSYVVTARSSGGGCVNRDTVVVTASIVDTSLVLLGKEAFCTDSPDSAVLVVNPEREISWYRNNALLTTGSTRLPVQQSGSYHAILRNTLGCQLATRTSNILVESPQRGIRYPDQFAVINQKLDLQARDFGTIYQWMPPVFLDKSNISNPAFNGNKDQQYLVGIRTASGCYTVDTVLVRVAKEVDIRVPTAFTPNGDGRNEYLSPILIGIKKLNYFRVYNRWGQLLYQSTEMKPRWDGRIKGTAQHTAAVVWLAEGVGNDGKTYSRKGTTIIIR